MRDSIEMALPGGGHPADVPSMSTDGRRPVSSAALAALIEAHRSRVAQLAYRLLGWREDVGDVVQDVFLAVLEKGSQFRGDADVSTWLTAITINQCRSRLRWRFLHRRRYSQTPPAEQAGCIEAADARSLDAEMLRRVREQVAALPAKYREVVVLRYLEGLSSAETSRVLGISSNAVDVRLNRARARLKLGLADLIEG